MDLITRQLTMDVWDIDSDTLRDGLKIKDALTGAVAKLGLVMTGSSFTRTPEGGCRCFIYLNSGWVNLSTFPAQRLLMMEAIIHDSGGMPAAIGEYVFRYFGGTEKLYRKTFLLERGVRDV
jgi:S-adenosylmethionine/arginine decarboxylase-like enzyme